MNKIPKFLKKYFWETDLEESDLKRHRIYIIRRIMEYGDEKAVAWLRRNFTKTEMREVLIKSRSFSKKSANYWALILGLPREKVRCLKRLSPKEQKKIWLY